MRLEESTDLIRAIPTQYRGFAFRSRLEARWAVFLDVCGIPWRYEDQGYDLDGLRYLPDFWLPEEDSFLEVKANRAAFMDQEEKFDRLRKASGKSVLVLHSEPVGQAVDEILKISCAVFPAKSGSWHYASMAVCPICHRVALDLFSRPWPCSCHLVGHPDHAEGRLSLALKAAQQARFEYGEQPETDIWEKVTFCGASDEEVWVYVAGAVTVSPNNPEILPWRAEIFGYQKHMTLTRGRDRDGRFIYGGPEFVGNHGIVDFELARDCIAQVRDAHELFAWIDRATPGTLAEIGAAAARGIPIFVAFATEKLSKTFYFVRDLGSVAIINPDPVSAWRLFKRWSRC
jgi:hypothetical protein